MINSDQIAYLGEHAAHYRDYGVILRGFPMVANIVGGTDSQLVKLTCICIEYKVFAC